MMQRGLYPAEFDPPDPDIRGEQILQVMTAVRRRYGSVRGYLLGAGASQTAHSRLQEILLEPDREANT